MKAKTAFATWAIAASLGIVLLAGFATYKILRPHAGTLSDRDTILIGAFENTTGEPLFDATLLTALKVQLGQSPFLDIVPDQFLEEFVNNPPSYDIPNLSRANNPDAATYFEITLSGDAATATPSS